MVHFVFRAIVYVFIVVFYHGIIPAKTVQAFFPIRTDNTQCFAPENALYWVAHVGWKNLFRLDGKTGQISSRNIDTCLEFPSQIVPVKEYPYYIVVTAKSSLYLMRWGLHEADSDVRLLRVINKNDVPDNDDVTDANESEKQFFGILSKTDFRLTSPGQGNLFSIDVAGCAISSINKTSEVELRKSNKTDIFKAPNIQWKEIHSQKGCQFVLKIQKYVINDLKSNYVSAQLMWNNFEIYCKFQAELILGVHEGDDSSRTKPRNKNMISKTRVKQQLIENRDKIESQEGDHRDRYFKSNSNKANKKSTAKSKLNEKYASYVKSSDGVVLKSRKNIKERWRQYYASLFNDEYPSEGLEPLSPVTGPIKEIHSDEIEMCLSKMKYNKSPGLDGISSEIWRKLGPVGVQWLTKLFSIIMKTRKIPETWRQDYLVSIYKNTGDKRDCVNYRGVVVKSQTLKIWERVLKNRIKHQITITPNQFAFANKLGRDKAVITIQTLMKKHRLNKEALHIVFLDLIKAYDTIPRRVVWQSLRAHYVSEEYINLLKDLYFETKVQVKTPVGFSKSFETKVGLHQGSALSPLLFNLAMDYLTKDIQEPLPWTLLYADDVALVANTTRQLQDMVSKWIKVLEGAGLRVSRPKTKYMACTYNSEISSSIIYYNDGAPIPKVKEVKYLGIIITPDTNVGINEKNNEKHLNVGTWRNSSKIHVTTQCP